MSPRHSLSMASLLALAAAAPARAQAPSPSPSPASRSEYVEVTATRVPEPPDEVPAAIEVFTGEELRDRNATDLRRALALAAGVDIAAGGDAGPAGSVPEFYGLKEFDAFLLVVDGVPWGGAFNPDLTTLDLTDVERVEVLRGPAPVMYGATSFVGVIHVVHKDAAATRVSGTLAGGSYESGRGALTVRLPAWAGFDSGLTADFTRQGFSDERTAFRRGHARWRNARALGAGRLRFDVDGTWLDQDPASPHPRQGAGLSPRVPLDANHNPEGAFLNDHRFTAVAGYERPLASALWSSIASFSRSSQDQLRGFLTGLDETGDNARGLRETIELTDLYFDSHVAWTSGARLKLVGGIDHLHGEGEARGADFGYFAPLDGSFAPPANEPAVLDIAIGDRRDFSGLYGFAEWNPRADLRLEAGVRLNRTAEEREEGEERPAGGPEEGQDHVRLSGSLGVAWTAWERGAENVRLFASYRGTFKPAAIDFGLEEGEGEEGILAPETSDSVEAGVRVRALDGRLGLDASAFLMDFHNLVISQAINGLPALVNAGSERFKGLEASASLRLRRDWSARVTYSLHDARFRDFLTEFDGEPAQLAGKRLEMSARHLAAAGLVHAPAHGLLAMAELQRVGSRFLNKRNTALAPAYTAVSGALGWRWGRWEARVDGSNLTDERPPVAESELGDAQYYRLPARRIEASASVRF